MTDSGMRTPAEASIVIVLLHSTVPKYDCATAVFDGLALCSENLENSVLKLVNSSQKIILIL